MLYYGRAKINLALDVSGRRNDGYHDVRMIMQTIGMYDRLELIPVRGRGGICLETNLSYLPTGENNLAYRAAKLLMDEAGVTDGLFIKLAKFIPVAAGLAGGSTDAAAAMKGVNEIFGLGLTLEELMERGRKIGADVPFCLLEGTALSEGTGEILTPLPDMPRLPILLCKINASVSTKEVYDAFDRTEVQKRPDIDRAVAALRDGDADSLIDPVVMVNVLAEVTEKKHPVITDIRETMEECGAARAIMSGSGPTVFGIFKDEGTAESAKEALRRKYPASRVFLTYPEGRREMNNV